MSRVTLTQSKSKLRAFVAAAVSAAAMVVSLAIPPAHAIDKCKVKVNPKTGALQVSGSDVTGRLRWGASRDEETNAFFNTGTCLVGGKAKMCELGAPGSPAQITPPQLCTLFVGDDGFADCPVYIKGCVPGIRPGDSLPDTKGDKGDTGSTGPAGAKGGKGDQGPIGAKGDKGDTGSTGPAGGKGDKGDQGPIGAVGPAGPNVIPSGETRSGYYSAAGVGGVGNGNSIFAEYYFPLKAPSTPTLNFVGRNDPFTANCPFKGRAAAGILCIYEMTDTGQQARFFPTNFIDTKAGFRVQSDGAVAGTYHEEAGIWAYTAP